jgi:hypothetical protein
MKRIYFTTLTISLIAASIMSTSSCTKEKTPSPALVCNDTISFSTDVLPIITDNCMGCHSAGNSTGYTFSNHANIKSNINAIIGSMKNEGFKLMPQGGPKLADDIIQKIECWKNQGTLDN